MSKALKTKNCSSVGSTNYFSESEHLRFFQQVKLTIRLPMHSDHLDLYPAVLCQILE